MTQHSQQSETSSSYRPDIDGLRALAVILVIAFHLFPTWMPAGFVGVDVFFVISGYLIGGILIKEAKNGGISIANFYYRRAVRILPAFLLVVATTWLLGWCLFYTDEYKALGKDIVAASLFASNLHAWNTTGYFAREAEMQPLLHLWSLGIEEQFYLVVPFLVGCLITRGFRVFKWILLITGGSFALCWYASANHPSAAFYWPMTRAWELLAGVALCALGSFPRSQWCAPAGWTLIALAMIFVRPDPGYPGWWGLLPVLGTVGIIGAGPDSWINRKLLSSPPLRYIGLLSYPWYLWHWPLLVACKVALPDEPSLSQMTGVATVSFLLAAMTVRLVEKPIRFSTVSLKRRATILMGGLVFLLALGALTARRIPEERLAASSTFANAQAAVTEKFPYPFQDNFGRITGFQLDAEEPVKDGESVVLFAGDSHMQHYWPRIQRASEQLGEDRLKWRIASAGGHPMLPGVNRIEEGYNCDGFFRFVLEEAKHPQVKRVVLSSAWQVYFLGPYPRNEGSKSEISSLYQINDPKKELLTVSSLDPVLQEFEKSLIELKSMGKDVVVILSSVSTHQWNPRKVARWHIGEFTPSNMSVNRSEFEAFMGPLKSAIAEAALRGGARTIDPCEYLTENGRMVGIEPDGRFRYQDHHHFREFYSLNKAAFIDNLLKQP